MSTFGMFIFCRYSLDIFPKTKTQKLLFTAEINHIDRMRVTVTKGNYNDVRKNVCGAYPVLP